MRFGVVLGNDPKTTASEAQLLEHHGFDTAWFPEVPLLGYGDPYVCMGLAAEATEHLRLGTFIAPAGMRVAPMLLTPFGTIGRIAPGRVRIGWGSGSYSRGLIGMSPLTVAELRSELEVLRDLLDRGRTDYHGTPIRFYLWDRPCLNLDAMPLEVAASGVRTAALAGELGDGLLTTGEIRPDALRTLLDAARDGALKAGRLTDRFTFTVDVGPLCVLRAGEKLDSPRVAGILQPRVTAYFSALLKAGTDPDELEADDARDGYVRFRAWVYERSGEGAIAVQDYLCDRVGGRIEEHDQFLSPTVIQSCALVGPASEIVDRLREIEHAGATDVAIVRNLDRPFVEGDELDQLIALREMVD